MSEEGKSICEFNFNLICEYYAGVERQGPGSPEVTIKALGFIDNLTGNSQIADLGCGTGGQTVTLAQNTSGNITGLDLYPGFIDIFNQNTHRLNLSHRVKGIVGSMDNLPFGKESLDLIWSEGAIYNIGFERGLNEWCAFLKTGGYIAVSELSWLTDERPDEIHDFWMENYPGIDRIPNKMAQMQKAGYVPVAAFVLPENCWTDHFYTPCSNIHEAFLNKHVGNKAARELIAFEHYEMQLYRKYKEFYGYVFFIGKKR